MSDLFLLMVTSKALVEPNYSARNFLTLWITEFTFQARDHYSDSVTNGFFQSSPHQSLPVQAADPGTGRDEPQPYRLIGCPQRGAKRPARSAKPQP